MSKTKQMKSLALLVIFFLFTVLPALGQQAKLTHHMSAEEKAKMPAYLESLAMRIQAAPPAPIRNIAEFEPMRGVLIAYPLGIPVSLVAQMSQDAIVTTIVDGSSQETTVRSYYNSNGVNLSNCDFLYAPHDSYWTRDYGPWFVTDGNGNISIVDFTYNRPRPNDNAIPSEVADFLGIDLFSMDLVQAGGNYMTDSMGISVSTDLVWDENSSLTHTQIAQRMEDNLGIATYHVTADPLDDYIKHVDCWGKYLATDKILITSVPVSDYRYSDYEAIATYFQNQTSPYGNNYRVYRVSSPDGQPYTNSLILNTKVYVPITGSAADSAAITAYQNAMPGYQIVAVSGSWLSTDALHCRVKGIADIDMLYIHHIPILGDQPEQAGYTISADLVPYSGDSVDTANIKVYYQIDGGSFSSVAMTHASGNTYTATIPGQTPGSDVGYYIYAADTGGKIRKHPLIGAPDPHVFTVVSSSGAPVAQFTANTTAINTGQSVSFTDQSTNTPTSWSWTFTGGTPSTSTAQNPTITYYTAGTYTVSLTATNASGSDNETKIGYITVIDPGITYCSSSGNNSNYEWIARVQVGSLDNPSGAAGYTDFTGITAQLTEGSSVSVTLTPGFASTTYNEYWKIYIDYNMDGDFTDTGEQVFSKSGTSAVSGSFTVPSGSEGTVTRMRVSMKYNSSQTSCETFSYGEVEDYTVEIVGGTVNPPVANFVANSTAIVTGQSVSFTDTSTNNPTSWSWTFTGGTPSTSTAQNPTITYNTAGTYTVSLTATNSAGSDNETKTAYIAVSDTPITYCSSSSNDSSYEYISRVRIADLDHSSGQSNYSDFTAYSATAAKGATVNVTLTPTFPSSSYTEYWRVWIDINHDGDFDDTGEQVFAATSSSTVSGTLTIPATALTGSTRMRVTMKYNAAPTPCETFSYGEVEDYTITIQ